MSNAIEHDVVYIHDTDDAWKVLAEDNRTIWLPKSQVTIEWRGQLVENRTQGTAFVPEWLAQEKGLI